MCAGPDAYPTHLIILQHNAHVADRGTSRIRGLPERRYGDVAVVRVDRSQEGIARERNVVGQPEHRTAMLGRPQFAAAAAELPQPDIGGRRREGHALLALLERE